MKRVKLKILIIIVIIIIALIIALGAFFKKQHTSEQYDGSDTVEDYVIELQEDEDFEIK